MEQALAIRVQLMGQLDGPPPLRHALRVGAKISKIQNLLDLPPAKGTLNECLDEAVRQLGLQAVVDMTIVDKVNLIWIELELDDRPELGPTPAVGATAPVMVTPQTTGNPAGSIPKKTPWCPQQLAFLLELAKKAANDGVDLKKRVSWEPLAQDFNTKFGTDRRHPGLQSKYWTTIKGKSNRDAAATVAATRLRANIDSEQRPLRAGRKWSTTDEKTLMKLAGNPKYSWNMIAKELKRTVDGIKARKDALDATESDCGSDAEIASSSNENNETEGRLPSRKTPWTFDQNAVLRNLDRNRDGDTMSALAEAFSRKTGVPRSVSSIKHQLAKLRKEQATATAGSTDPGAKNSDASSDALVTAAMLQATPPKGKSASSAGVGSSTAIQRGHRCTAPSRIRTGSSFRPRRLGSCSQEFQAQRLNEPTPGQ